MNQLGKIRINRAKGKQKQLIKLVFLNCVVPIKQPITMPDIYWLLNAVCLFANVICPLSTVYCQMLIGDFLAAIY